MKESTTAAPVKTHSLGEIRALTGIRGVAALTVAIAHFDLTSYVPSLAPIGRLFFWHNTAVDLFFMLSAFVLCHVYLRVEPSIQNVKHYAAARFARIYPLYLATFFFVLALSCFAAWKRGAFADDLTIGDGIRQILMVNAWPVIGTNRHWDFPAWSISAEVFCYTFIFPLIWLWKRHWHGMPVWLLVLSLFLLLGSDFAINLWGLDYLSEHGMLFPCLRASLGFLIGTMVFALHGRPGGWSRYASIISNITGILFLGVLIAASLGALPYLTVLWTFPLLILTLSMENTSLVAKGLGTKVVHYLGAISYSIYLWHHPIEKTLSGVFPKMMSPAFPHRPLVFTLLVFLTLVVATISYECFEKPARRIVRGKLAH